MKKTIAISLIFLTTAYLPYTYAEEKHSHENSNHDASASLAGLSLNNGNKWEMDEHTRVMSKKMKQTFFAADHSTKEGLKAVSAELQTQVDKLIVGCTMQGKSHNQLHVFLNDHIPTINALNKAQDYSSAKASAIKLKGQFEKYPKYFK